MPPVSVAGAISQVVNALSFTRNAVMVIHVAVSTKVSGPDWDWIRSQPRIIINPRRYKTSASITEHPNLHCNVLRAHMSNIKHSLQTSEKFTHVILKASNE